MEVRNERNFRDANGYHIKKYHIPAPPVSPRVSEPGSDLESSAVKASVTVEISTTPGLTDEELSPSKDKAPSSSHSIPVKATEVVTPVNADSKPNLWTELFKGSENLHKTGEAFQLPSGEACVRIPNSIIEKNKKAWECFILGQFYHEPPSQGTIHNIVNGIWSKQFRDISVSKMEGNAFLFRIPHAATRRRVIKQGLWHIEGQTMFVADWVPRVIPDKPELTSAHIWLELRDVPLQCFNEEALERIAGLVGHPKCLHPSTINKANLEVAKVLTLKDPRVPLLEAVNAQFESGEIRRIKVSSPWMPPVCPHCKEIGHSLKHCTAAPILCKQCKSRTHSAETCQKAKAAETKPNQSRRAKARSREAPFPTETPASGSFTSTDITFSESGLGKSGDQELEKGSTSGRTSTQQDHQKLKTSEEPEPGQINIDAVSVGIRTDSSDIDSSEAEAERQIAEKESRAVLSGSKKKHKKKKSKRGKGPKSH